MSTVINAILETRIVAIVRLERYDRAVEITRALLAGGISAVEFTLTGAGAYDAIAATRAALGDAAQIGVGTVLNVDTADGIDQRRRAVRGHADDVAGGNSRLCGARHADPMRRADADRGADRARGRRRHGQAVPGALWWPAVSARYSGTAAVPADCADRRRGRRKCARVHRCRRGCGRHRRQPDHGAGGGAGRLGPDHGRRAGGGRSRKRRRLIQFAQACGSAIVISRWVMLATDPSRPIT